MGYDRVHQLILHGSVCLLVLLVTAPSTSYAFFGEWGDDLKGDWCARRPRGMDCCTGRDDDCRVPILGTECYCDIFCNKTAYDCCPDYWDHCHGYRRQTTTPRPTTLPPPRRPCVKDGVRYQPGEIIVNNCNKCTCELEYFSQNRYDWQCTNDPCLVRPEMINLINSGPYTWKARNYTKFWGMTLDQGVRNRLGTFLYEIEVLKMSPIRVLEDALPESFDARIKWPNLLNPIRDQGNCASSWAHSTTAVASDRLSIETNGAIQSELSVQHLLSCDVDDQEGCQGGHLDRAWWYLRKKGVVTEKCYPYTSGKSETPGKCYIRGKLRGRCPSGIDYKSTRRYKATPPYKISPQEREIMKEIKDNGPVQATFQVREDFFMYAGGVYSYTALTTRRGEPEQYIKSGFHSVRIMGWGAERTREGDIIKYWLCANSWGTDWGENGYFRIRRGTDESQIERYVVGVWGNISGDDILNALLLDNRRRRLRGERRRKRRQLRNLKFGRQRNRPYNSRRSRRHNKSQRKQHKKKSRKNKKNKKWRQSQRRWKKNLKKLPEYRNKQHFYQNIFTD